MAAAAGAVCVPSLSRAVLSATLRPGGVWSTLCRWQIFGFRSARETFVLFPRNRRGGVRVEPSIPLTIDQFPRKRMHFQTASCRSVPPKRPVEGRLREPARGGSPHCPNRPVEGRTPEPARGGSPSARTGPWRVAPCPDRPVEGRPHARTGLNHISC